MNLEKKIHLPSFSSTGVSSERGWIQSGGQVEGGFVCRAMYYVTHITMHLYISTTVTYDGYWELLYFQT